MKPRLAPYLFVLPNVAIVVALALYPFAYNLYLSTQRWRPGSSSFVGLENYLRLLGDPVFHQSVLNNLVYMAGVVPLTLILSLLVAIGLNEKIPARSALRSLYFLPYLFSWSVAGIIWRWIYSSNYGILNIILESFGIPPQQWLLNPNLVLPSIMVATVWSSLGYYMVIFLAGLQGISPTYYEAAKVDGAGVWARFQHITLPALRPITFMVVVLAVMNSFRIFEQIYVMTGGGPARASFVLVLYLYVTGFVEQDVGYAAAMATALLVIMLAFTYLQTRVFAEGDDE